MFMSCFSQLSQTSQKQTFNSKNRHYKEVTNRLTAEQIAILSLIFQDLSTRNAQKLLTFETFLNFFNLTGLWGAKLFYQFDEDGKQLISFEEFLYGISQTAKAPFQQKIRLLYCFFESKIDEGIHFKNFTKMLYNYSKDELKQILLRDQLITQQPQTSYPIIKRQNTDVNILEHKIVEVKMPESGRLKTKTSFDEAYQSLLNNHNEGTYLQIDSHDLKYKIKYSNMNSLIEQFAANVYAQHHIDVKLNPNSTLSYQNFSSWIKEHKKLFKSYYSAFQTQIWAVKDGEPGYMAIPVEYQFTGKMQCGSMKSKIYGFQVGDVIICCQSKKNKRKPLKIICLQGLNIQDYGETGILISHLSDCYKNQILWFDSTVQHKKWLQHLKIYERDSIHQNYFIREVIGNGKFSIVYKCIQKISGKAYALKVIDLSKLNQKAKKAISNETQILKIINHPQIVKYMDTVHTKTHQYILTDYIYGEDLYAYVTKRNFLNQFQSAFIIGNIIKATMYLHDLDIIHRDLKPQNIMVMFRQKKMDQIFQCTTPLIRQGQRIQNIKIIDFGLANHVSKIQKMDKSQKVSGTPNYIAPQLLLGEPCTHKSDVFSIGSILYFLLSGRLPFASVNIQKTLMKTVRGDYDIESHNWKDVSQDAKDLLNGLLEVNPHSRLTLKQAVNHQWFQAIFNKTRNTSQLIQCSQNRCNQINPSAGQEQFNKNKIKLQGVSLEEIQNKRKASFNQKGVSYSQINSKQ